MTRAVAGFGLVVTTVLAATAVPGHTAGTVAVAFESYGVMFSRETRQPIAIDPNVFIQVAGGESGVGPGDIQHAAGLAPAPLEDPPSSPLYSADKKPLQITLGRWLSASGKATLVRSGNGVRVTATFKNLIAQGSYSLFRITRNQDRSMAAPLDGTGTTNNLQAAADGTGSLTVLAPAALVQGQAIVLLYHSDRMTHVMSQGAPGLTAHYQLVARPR